MNEQFLPTPEWPLEEVWKRKLHERIQTWGERVAPLFETVPPDEKESKIHFFKVLVESVPNEDKDTAYLVDSLYDHAREACSHGDAFDEIRGERFNPDHSPFLSSIIQRQFDALYSLYQKGVATTSLGARE